MERKHDEAMACEAAKASIGNWIAILSNEIQDERAKATPNVSRLRALNTEVSRLVRERLALRIGDHAEITRIRSRYNATYDPASPIYALA